MQHPAGEYYKGVTYVCFQGPLEDAWVAAYNHATNKWSGPFKAGVSKLGKTPGDKIDNHGKPAMIIDNEGYIHIVFGGHGGMPEHGPNTLGNTHKGDMIHVVSQKPQDISRWEVLDNIPPFGTYNQFVKMDNGDIYLFYRHGAHRSNWVYQKSTNNGRSFEQEVSILKHKIQDDNPGIHDSWYCWFTKGQGEEIIMTYNYHVCKDLNHDGERQNCYYMVMNTNDYTWRNVKGEVLTVPVTKAHADKMTLVVDTENKWTTRGTVRLDQAGNPHLTYNEGEHMGLKHGGPRQVKYYRWTGQMWDGGYDTNLPVSAVGDILISSPTEVNLLLDGRGEVAWWHTTNGGQSFTKGEVLIRQEKTNFAITSWLRNAHPNARVVAVGKIGSSDFRKMYLLGDEGPVKRLKAEADKLDD
ncbi:MAG: BNR-4 repeat-containing protein [Bacteroidales bacterium]|nr:BNR-4 repeat-containing protein [Bacteroidales bacterium]